MNDGLTVEAYHLHIELLDSDPPIWRRVCVPGNTPLAQLHRVIAAAMGWSGEADYLFKGQGRGLADGEVRDLSTLLAQPNDTLLYTYSPAQGWLHKVTLESAGPADSAPHCTAGEGHCPPEFCNGVWDYLDLLERLEDSGEPDVDDLWRRIGYDFDPDRFDQPAANRRLASLSATS
ncbi:MAG TPA: plasmid pRiA4b ORF-3 family protein [Nodosilinea sp.]|nr:plasmid pRiA4b ORF-3 family protein [Nodosilinea sp.]